MKKLGLIHTTATLIPVFQALVDKYLGDRNISVFNISDDSLIKNTIESGTLTTDTRRRVIDYVVSAKDAGADYILVTCSSIGPAVETAATLVDIPVLRVDQPMVDKAVQMGKKIGVIATLSTTLEPTSDLVRRRALFAKKEVEVITKLCEGAFEALMSGNIERHDQSVVSALKELSRQVEVIILAQASMARVINQLSEEDRKVPILASPELAMQYLSEVL